MSYGGERTGLGGHRPAEHDLGSHRRARCGIDPVARRLLGVPVLLNRGLGDDVGLIIAPDTVTVDHDGAVEVKWSDTVSDAFACTSATR